MGNIQKNPQESKSSSKPAKTGKEDPLIPELINILCHTQDEELSCDEVFDMVDEYAELKAKGVNVEQLYPLLRIHIERCQDCQEEYEALLRVLNSE